jgi:hypothetical protein
MARGINLVLPLSRMFICELVYLLLCLPLACLCYLRALADFEYGREARGPSEGGGVAGDRGSRDIGLLPPPNLLLCSPATCAGVGWTLRISVARKGFRLDLIGHFVLSSAESLREVERQHKVCRMLEMTICAVHAVVYVSTNVCLPSICVVSGDLFWNEPP